MPGRLFASFTLSTSFATAPCATAAHSRSRAAVFSFLLLFHYAAGRGNKCAASDLIPFRDNQPIVYDTGVGQDQSARENLMLTLFNRRPDGEPGARDAGPGERRARQESKVVPHLDSVGVHGSVGKQVVDSSTKAVTVRFVFPGYDMIEWLMERLNIEDSGNSRQT